MPGRVHISVSDDLHQALKLNEEDIKGEFLTLTLFVDSAIRSMLRKRGYQVGPDRIVAHLKKLKESKARHINQQALIHLAQMHRQRVKRQEQAVKEIVEE